MTSMAALVFLLLLGCVSSQQQKDYYPPPPSTDNPHFYPEDYAMMVKKFENSRTYALIKPNKETLKMRERVTINNLKFINANNKNPNRDYNMKVNEFIFLTKKEFISIYATLMIPDSHRVMIMNVQNSPFPPSYLEQTLITTHTCYSGSPMHQGLCGACYAIAPTDAMAISMAKYNIYY